MKPVVAVLGGSTPFTAALVEALRDEHAGVPACELRLYGRELDALLRMRRYAERRLGPLGWTASSSPRLEEAVDGANVVVNQIRFGGLAGRARDEALANRFGLPADETLGPCGLNSALRVVPRIRELAAELGRSCPDAWVLNLSNPLSINTRVMIGAGAPKRCFGLCELPLTTVLETCRLLRISLADVEWSYAGLNHRGFIFALEHRGEDVLPRVPDLLDGHTVFGITGEEIRRLGAIPLKYFGLSTSPKTAAPTHRARYLGELRDAVTRELDAGAAPPPSLSKRDLSWYEAAVVLMMGAIFSADGRRVVVNCLREDGLVHEVPARVTREGVQVVPTRPPPYLQPWLQRWEAHERAVLDAVEAPTAERIEHALELDPAVPSERVKELAQAIWAEREG